MTDHNRPEPDGTPLFAGAAPAPDVPPRLRGYLVEWPNVRAVFRFSEISANELAEQWRNEPHIKQDPGVTIVITPLYASGRAVVVPAPDLGGSRSVDDHGSSL